MKHLVLFLVLLLAVSFAPELRPDNPQCTAIAKSTNPNATATTSGVSARRFSATSTADRWGVSIISSTLTTAHACRGGVGFLWRWLSYG